MAEERFFTLEQARALLPQVKRVAEKIAVVSQQIAAIAKRDLEGRSLPDTLVPGSYFRRLLLQAGLERHLASMGVMLKDRERGLCDFPALYDGKVVLLCWQMGEDDIGYFHDLESGFAGRRPVSELGNPTKPD